MLALGCYRCSCVHALRQLLGILRSFAIMSSVWASKGICLLDIFLCAIAGVVDKDIKSAMLLDSVSNALLDRCIVRNVQLLHVEIASCNASRDITRPIEQNERGVDCKSLPHIASSLICRPVMWQQRAHKYATPADAATAQIEMLPSPLA